jgi:segregation and condensation protein A
MQAATLLRPSSALLFKLPIFEGPLDLLLHLIREQKIDIYDIPIAQITEQYLATMAHWDSMNLAIAGEYLVMAATLIEIKSRLLLPSPPPLEGEEEPEDPRAELVQRLLEYQLFEGTVETLRGWEDYRRTIFFRGALENPDDYVLPLPEGALDAGALLNALKRILESAGVADEPITAVMPKRRVGLRMKMAEVVRRVEANPAGIEFSCLFDLPCLRAEIVITFLAMLELIRLGRIYAVQARKNLDILLTPGSAVPS